MSTVTDPVERFGLITGISVIGAVVAWILFGLLTSPVLYLTIRTSPEVAGLAVLGIVGWGIWFGQMLLNPEFREMRQTFDEEMELSWLATILLVMGNIGYYNVLLFFTVGIGIIIANAGFPTVAALFALVYPAYDGEVLYRGVPISLSGILVIGLAFGLVLLSTTDEVTWRDLGITAPIERLIGAPDWELL